MDYDFDNNNQDNLILNGADVEHNLDEFNDVDCDLNDLDNLDFSDEQLEMERLEKELGVNDYDYWHFIFNWCIYCL